MSFILVKPTFRLVALLLLALWLPATLHCDWVGAGFIPAAITCQDDHSSSGVPADNCGLIENSTYRTISVTLKVPPPTLLTCLCCLVEITPERILVPLISPERSDSPPELARTWQFRHRAAPPARAPGLIA